MLLRYTWLPSDLADSSAINVHVVKAHGSHMITGAGEKIFDAISSWWCKPLGHAHPVVVGAIRQQLDLFEHHLAARAWNDNIEGLSTKLIKIFDCMDKVMYASDGSSAIEIAMKLSYETRILCKEPHRNKYVALSGSYHGETIFTLGVCGIHSYKSNYQALLQDNYFIDDIPYVSGRLDPLWSDSNFDYSYWESFFADIAPTTTALIIEPIVQGAAGMKIISRDWLIKLINVAKTYDIHIIADEIMVGLGRLGCYSVSKEILDFEPDIVCFAKNLTAGSIPMSAIVVNKSITDIFRHHEHIFTHSHTHSCNALAAAAANSYLDYLADSNMLSQVVVAENKLLALMHDLQQQFNFIRATRAIGSIAAMELNLPDAVIAGIFELGIGEGIYLRPIGNVLYIMPPLYNILMELDTIRPKLYSLLTVLTNYQIN